MGVCIGNHPRQLSSGMQRRYHGKLPDALVNSNHRDLQKRCQRNQEPFLSRCPSRALSQLHEEAYHFAFSRRRNVLIPQAEPQRVALRQRLVEGQPVHEYIKSNQKHYIIWLLKFSIRTQFIISQKKSFKIILHRYF